MPKHFEFLYDIVSPTAYLAWYEAPRVAERTGAEIVYVPVFLGGIMQATGNRPPGSLPAKAKYFSVDMPRCAAHVGVPFHFNPAFPMNTLAVQRATVGLDDPEERFRLAKACFDLSWGRSDPLNVGEDAGLRQACEVAGLDADRIKALSADPANKAILKENTERAVERGTFGAPTFFVGDEIFFGHDRLDYVGRAVEANA